MNQIEPGSVLTAIGLVAGLLGAAGMTRLMAGLLFQVSPFDPKTFLLAPAVLATVAFLASYLPAKRAAKIDPVTALRQE